MIEILNSGTYYINNDLIVPESEVKTLDDINKILSKNNKESITEKEFNNLESKKNTISYDILNNHNISGKMDYLNIKFDAITSHDITYVGIIQTSRASGLEKFPIPYVLTNCHNSLCAVGGTINEDDHLYGLSAAKKYGGIYVPAHQAVIHQYMREMMAGCKKMILGSDSHTRYGALGTMAMGEGGPELVKQILNRTYDIKCPEVVGIYLHGKPRAGVGPQDIALAIIGKVFKSGTVKNRVMEFIGPAIKDLTVEYRNGIDVMTTETTCLSSIWVTDDKVREYLKLHGRENEYSELKPGKVAYYDNFIKVDLSNIKPQIAVPFHPSNVYSIEEFNENAYDILKEVEEDAKNIFSNNTIDIKYTDKIVDGKVQVLQGVIGGCSGGTYENIDIAAKMAEGKSVGDDEFALNIYPASQPVYYELMENGSLNKLMEAGANIKTAFCGPCFGAGDVPANNSLSIRHNTRNFPNREGSKPSDGQIASVALMDSRSIMATALNGGFITAATEDTPTVAKDYKYNPKIYKNRVYQGFKKANDKVELRFGPNIKDWPEMIEITDNLLLDVACVINDPVTTTDELIPSGETSSYRSNPLKLASFALSRKDPNYVDRAQKSYDIELLRRKSIEKNIESKEVEDLIGMAKEIGVDIDINNTAFGSVIYANKPGDGSAREQAASVQKVLGGFANIAKDYATKRYRSNVINWGMLPLITKEDNLNLKVNDYIYLKDVKSVLESDDKEEIKAVIISKESKRTLYLPDLVRGERDILLKGCLINYYN
jgi:aconitate hydratase